MPDHREFQNNAVSSSSNASPDNLEEAMWRLKVEDGNQEGFDANHQNPYPDRPGVADCIYYLRTGLCGYGSNCRYNHPTYIGQETQDRTELPERVGQPDCQYFLKTGTCKFGATCKYHHPRERHDVPPAPLNMLGLPMRQVEKSCPYYMRTGSCKFGFACKFDHPQPAGLGAVFPATGPSAYRSTGSSLVPQSNLPLIGGLSAWPLARSYLSNNPRMQGLPAYMHVILPSCQGHMPLQQGWSTYTEAFYVNQGSMSQLPSSDVFGPTHIPNNKIHSQSGSSTVINLPERPDQPECQYYMKSGHCRYGTACKYNHPRGRYSESPFTLGPLGLPLRPGHAVCSFYTMYGSCKYGSACKFDHPLMGFHNYAVPTLSIPDPLTRIPQNQRNSETSIAKTLKLKKSKEANNTEAKVDFDNNEETNDTQNAAPSSDSPQNHFD